MVLKLGKVDNPMLPTLHLKVPRGISGIPDAAVPDGPKVTLSATIAPDRASEGALQLALSSTTVNQHQRLSPTYAPSPFIRLVFQI